ncbi:hypothetical protein BDD12DRAFT_902440 [Trichophaea hybrida]|nr:hypothetical protein BDD12DRAFT_902440 [Trichophaea hybrida]
MTSLILKSTSKWTPKDYEQFGVLAQYSTRGSSFPVRDDGGQSLQLTAAEIETLQKLFGEVTSPLCGIHSGIQMMLESFITQHAPGRSASFFIDLGRVMATNPGVIPVLKTPLLQPQGTNHPAATHHPALNHPAPETTSPRVPTKRIRTTSVSTDAGANFDWTSPLTAESVSSAGSNFKLSSSDVDEDDDADQDRVHCETVTQAMLLSFLQTISNARVLRTILTTHKPNHRRIDVVGLHGTKGPTTFTSINDGSLVAKIKTGTSFRKGLGTFTTYDKDPNMILCALECKRVSGGKDTFPQQAGEILAAMYDRFCHLFYFADGLSADTFMDGMSWAERTMFLISAEQSKIRLSQATFTPAFLKQMLGYQSTVTEKLEVMISPEFNLALHSHRMTAAELVSNMLGLLESEWKAFFEKKAEKAKKA